MLQICSRKELLRPNNVQQNYRRQNQNHRQPSPLTQTLSDSFSTTSSSASSTISSSSADSNLLLVSGALDAPDQDTLPPLTHQSVPNLARQVHLTSPLLPAPEPNTRNLIPAIESAQANCRPYLFYSSDHHPATDYSSIRHYPAPPPRPWIQSSQLTKQVTRSQQSGQPEFTVISYNVLCDRMVSNEWFPTSPDIALDWTYRRELILKQLLEFNSDIIALQELELEQFEEHFKPELFRFGNYESIFEPKSRARTMDSEKRKRVDGCAIFYKLNR